MSDSSNQIVVAVRCRRLLDFEVELGGHSTIDVIQNKMVILQDPQTTALDDYLRINKSKERHFRFDYAYGEHSTTAEIYRDLIGGGSSSSTAEAGAGAGAGRLNIA